MANFLQEVASTLARYVRGEVRIIGILVVLWRILGVVGVFVVVQTLEGFVLTPRILGKSVGLSAMTVFVCGLIGGALFGPLGLLLAVPIAAVAAVAWRFAFKRT
jgi:predicted PurR-regulated permease PerM